MKRLFWRIAPEALLGLALVGLGGCNPNNDVQAGPPVLLSFSVVDSNTGATLDLSSDGSPSQIPGYVHLTALFDRLLDGAVLSAVDGSVDYGSDVVSVVASPPLPATPVATFTSIYTPNGGPGGLVFPAGPFITTTADLAFPSSATITARLDMLRVRSKKGEPFTGAGELIKGEVIFQTAAFAATIGVPTADPDPDAGADPDAGPPPVKAQMQPVSINFNNVAGSDIATHVTVTAGGVPFTDVTVGFANPDSPNPTAYAVTPNTTWPPNTTVVVTIDAAAADPFGNTMGMVASDSFTTSGS